MIAVIHLFVDFSVLEVFEESDDLAVPFRQSADDRCHVRRHVLLRRQGGIRTAEWHGRLLHLVTRPGTYFLIL